MKVVKSSTSGVVAEFKRWKVWTSLIMDVLSTHFIGKHSEASWRISTSWLFFRWSLQELLYSSLITMRFITTSIQLCSYLPLFSRLPSRSILISNDGKKFLMILPISSHPQCCSFSVCVNGRKVLDWVMPGWTKFKESFTASCLICENIFLRVERIDAVLLPDVCTRTLATAVNWLITWEKARSWPQILHWFHGPIICWILFAYLSKEFALSEIIVHHALLDHLIKFWFFFFLLSSVHIL